MVEAPVAASLRRERLCATPARSLSESRRAWNREHIGAVSTFRCECDQLNCGGKVPAVAETHRGSPERFVVTPAHINGGLVVRAADRFFVVEPVRHARGATRVRV